MPAPRGVFALLVSLMVASATFAAALAPEPVAALAGWPPSSGLVVAEVVTGGASASDEYVEIANAGSAEADLGGLEVVYVTASGSTTTKKATFAAPLPIGPGRHLLVANAAGIYGSVADTTYTGGFAADGGTIVLRHTDGTVVDAVGWGTAANAYVEGTAAAAPPAGSSIERLPGGSAGNSVDTNDNASDWRVQPNPIAQSLASGAPGGGDPTELPATSEPDPTPGPTEPLATDGATAAPSSPTDATPTQSATAIQTPAPTMAATSTPTSTPAANATPTAAATATPSGALLGEVPSSSPAPTEAAADMLSIDAARALPVGTRVHVAGVVGVGPGIAGADDLISVQDSSGGIFVRIAASAGDLPVGRTVEVEGTLSAPYGQLEIRSLVAFIVGLDGAEPIPVRTPLGEIGEGTEGSLVTVIGTVDSVQMDSGRLTITIGDGSAVVRLLADPAAGVSREDVARAEVVIATGIVGQHATATGRLDGYRIWLRRSADISVPPPIATDAPESPPAPTAAVVHHDLASALGLRGSSVDVEATVTATAGLLDIGSPTIVVDDGTAAVAVLLPAAAAVPQAGMRVRVAGKIGRWEGGPTVLASTVTIAAGSQTVGPRAVAGALDPSLEWQLIRVCGRVERYTPAGSRWRIDLNVSGHTVAVLGEPAAAITMSAAAVGRLALVTGIVRRSTSDSSVFQMIPRLPSDLSLGPAPAGTGPSTTASGITGASAGATGSGGSAVAFQRSVVAIDTLSSYVGLSVTVAGLVTDTTEATATIDDGTGAVRVGGEAAADALAMLQPGDAIEVTGLVREDEDGLFIDVDPASIVAMPGGPDEAEAAVSGVTATPSHIATPSATRSPADPDAASASTRIAAPPAAPPDVWALLAVLLAVLAAIAAALVIARHSGQLRRSGFLTRLIARFSSRERGT